MNNQTLTQSRLKELLHYNPETGIFTWLVSKKGVKIGNIAGSVNSIGYRYISVDRILYKASRLAWLFIEGYFPENDVDHINRIRDDDRWKNLRHVSRQCNSRNCGMFKNNTSGVTGVSLDNKNNKWKAQIMINKKQIHLGYFSDKTEAVRCRLQAEQKYNFKNCNSTSSAYLYLKHT